jgi:hypothetical protein
MISYGTVTEYDRGRRAGVIKPDVLGAPAISQSLAPSRCCPNTTAIVSTSQTMGGRRGQ